MKLVKTLLVTTAISAVAFNASAKSHFEGTFVGAQFGASKAGNTKADTKNTVSYKGLDGYKKEEKWGVTGGVLVGHRAAVAQDVILGVSLGVDLDSAKAKESITLNNGSTEAKRKYIVNLLGQAGYTVTKDVLAFVTAGVSYTQFKFSASDSSGSTSKNKSKFGYAVGAGAAYAINDTVSTDLQYLYTGYGSTKKATTVGANNYVEYAPKAYHTVTVGVKVNI